MPIYPPTLSDHIGPISVSLGDSTKPVQPLSAKDRKMLSEPQGHFCKPRSLYYKIKILFVYFLQLEIKDLNAAPTCLHFVWLGRP